MKWPCGLFSCVRIRIFIMVFAVSMTVNIIYYRSPYLLCSRLKNYVTFVRLAQCPWVTVCAFKQSYSITAVQWQCGYMFGALRNWFNDTFSNKTNYLQLKYRSERWLCLCLCLWLWQRQRQRRQRTATATGTAIGAWRLRTFCAFDALWAVSCGQSWSVVVNRIEQIWRQTRMARHVHDYDYVYNYVYDYIVVSCRHAHVHDHVTGTATHSYNTVRLNRFSHSHRHCVPVYQLFPHCAF